MAESARKGHTIIENTDLTRSGQPARGSSILAWVAGIAALGLGAVLIWFSAWRQPLLDGEAAAAAGDWPRALERYTTAEARFNDWPWSQQLFPSIYRAALANQLAAQYRLGALDAVLEKAETVPATAASHFWTGSALFDKSRAEENAEARLSWLGRATDEFKAVLELEPENWDAIYNYELTKRLFEELRKKPQDPSQAAPGIAQAAAEGRQQAGQEDRLTPLDPVS